MNHSIGNESGLWFLNSSWNPTSATDTNKSCATLQRSIGRSNSIPLASNILIMVFNSCSSIFAAVLNLLVMIVLSRKEEFDTAANLILKSMALSDFLVGLTVQPLTVVFRILDFYGLESCNLQLINSYLGIVCVGASMLSVTMFSIDRCFAIWFPFRYQEHVIYKKYAAIIFCGWIFLLFSVLVTIFNLFPKSFLIFVMTICFSCCVLAICFCYVVIFMEVRKKKRMIHVPLASVQPINVHASAKDVKELVYDAKKVIDASSATNTYMPHADTKVIKQVPRSQRSPQATGNAANSSKQMSRSYTVLVILSVFLLCYLPVTIVRVISQNQGNHLQAQIMALDWTNFLVLLNSSINPVIYCIRLQKIRREIKRLVNL